MPRFPSQCFPLHFSFLSQAPYFMSEGVYRGQGNRTTEKKNIVEEKDEREKTMASHIQRSKNKIKQNKTMSGKETNDSQQVRNRRSMEKERKLHNYNTNNGSSNGGVFV